MRKRRAALQIVTANRLVDGIAVYLDSASRWSECLGTGEVARTEDRAEALMKQAAIYVAERKVVGPYLIEVSDTGGHIAPVRLRERIRANGPTVRPDLGRIAAAE